MSGLADIEVEIETIGPYVEDHDLGDEDPNEPTARVLSMLTVPVTTREQIHRLVFRVVFRVEPPIEWTESLFEEAYDDSPDLPTVFALGERQGR